MINDEEFREAVKSMRNRTARLEHEGDYWTPREREALNRMFDEGVGITEIAVRLQRTEPAISQQLEKMDAYQRRENPARRRKRRHKNKTTKCLCSECRAGKKICPLSDEHTEKEEQ